MNNEINLSHVLCFNGTPFVKEVFRSEDFSKGQLGPDPTHPLSHRAIWSNSAIPRDLRCKKMISKLNDWQSVSQIKEYRAAASQLKI